MQLGYCCSFCSGCLAASAVSEVEGALVLEAALPLPVQLAGLQLGFGWHWAGLQLAVLFTQLAGWQLASLLAVVVLTKTAFGETQEVAAALVSDCTQEVFWVFAAEHWACTCVPTSIPKQSNAKDNTRDFMVEISLNPLGTAELPDHVGDKVGANNP